MRSRIVWMAGPVRWLIAAVLVAVPAAGRADTALSGVADLQRVARLIGPGSINGAEAQWNVAGADLGHLFEMGDRLYMVFGDTYGRGFVAPPGAGPMPDWRSNVMAVIADKTPADGLAFERMITDVPGHAKELIPPRHDAGEQTAIPTNGIAVGTRMYLHYMGVQSWGAPGEWTLARAGLAYSDDGGQNWTRLPWSWPSATRFGQVAFVRSGAYVYLFGIPGGRLGGVCLARVAESGMAEQAAYRYYAGIRDGAVYWSPDERDAVQIVAPPVGELSVMWDAFLQRWILTDLTGPDLVIREAPELTGPWSAPRTLVSAHSYPGLYGAYMHPWLVERDGEIVYFTMSEWGTYGVSLMRVRLVKNAPAWTRDDALRALALWGGMESATSTDMQRLGAGGPGIDLALCTRVLRSAFGLRSSVSPGNRLPARSAR